MTVRLAMLGLCLTLLAACSLRNPARVDLCLAVITALEPGSAPIVVEDIAGSGPGIDIWYRLAGAETPGHATCVFEGGATSLSQLELASVTFNGHDLGPGRLTFIKSHWLADEGPDTVKARVVRPAAGLVSIGRESGPYLQSALAALPIASAYVLLALGFALIHGITGRINIAHGEFATVGAYAGYAGFIGFGAASLLSGIAGSVGFAMVAAACAGWLTIRSVFIPLARQEGLMLLVASVGLILIFEESIRLSHNSRELWVPPVLSDPVPLSLPPYVVTVTPLQLAIAAAAMAAAAVVLAMLRFTRFGRAWRAVADDPLAAQFMGIDPARVLGLSAMMASGLAGAAGLAILLGYGNAGHSMGLMLSFKAMVAALIGGMGSPGGAVLGALVLVAVETFWVVGFGSVYRDVAVFVMLVVLLTLLPNGLFGLARK